MVTASAKRRVAALEDAHGGNKCPGCGFGRNEKPPWRINFVRHGASREPDRWCGECGRKLVHNVNMRW